MFNVAHSGNECKPFVTRSTLNSSTIYVMVSAMSVTAPTEGPIVPEITLPIRLRLARDAAGFNQEELADRIGISRRTVANYEVGRHPTRRPYLLSWALATGVDISWLMTGVAEDGTCPQCGEPVRNRCFCGSAQVIGLNPADQ
jgi:DNA-binding XRE family transcriptional regulator